MRILLVEDDPDLSRQLKLALADAGYAVDHAPDGEEAQFLGETEPYDAVILDDGLPDGSAEAVARELSALHADLAVLITSSGNTRQLTERFAHNRRVEVIEQPYTGRQLSAALKRMGVLPD